jgi:hypothetical protein
MKLLTIGDAKTSKGESLGILTGILYLNPATTEKICPYATEYCKALCLVNSGRAEIFPAVMNARTRKTLAFLSDKQAFIAQLHKDIQALRKRAVKRGMRAAVRLNGTSDILWERLIDFSAYPDVQFYDYTKVPLGFRKRSKNYHLTFSFSGNNFEACEQALAQGVNVAMVFEKHIPKTYHGRKVIDGTQHDVRFLDKGKGLIIGLCAKGRRAKAAAKAGTPFIIKAA